ncbi:MAG: hypothetical protein HQM14_20095 [SAR324 cluster bacterium]|nr:hypothetical protein [SAR324 cluster bacterium]
MKSIMKNILMLVSFVAFVTACASLSLADGKKSYEDKVKVNDETIGVIAGVINYICPKLVDASTNICNPKDPVGSAVGIQKQMGDIEDLDMLDREELADELAEKKIIHVEASMQFYDAVEQFKLHYPLREKAKKAAEQGDWSSAAVSEEMAWQYLVKTASRGIFAKKMVDGE